MIKVLEDEDKFTIQVLCPYCDKKIQATGDKTDSDKLSDAMSMAIDELLKEHHAVR